MLAIKRNEMCSDALTRCNSANRKKINHLVYVREGKHYGHVKYVNYHCDCHNIQVALAEICRQNPDMVDKYYEFIRSEQVVYYCAGIRPPGLSSAVGTIKTNVHLKRDFEGAQAHIAEMIRHNKLV